MRIEQLRRLAAAEEIDYQFLLDALKDYTRPRDKISQWLKTGDLLRVKKGLYIFGQHIAYSPYSLEVLANRIYGPSAISLVYALSYYGMIPERVSVITSITSKRHKKFSTPIGYFEYFYLSQKKYCIGIDIIKTASKQQVLIASPEKALCDQIHIIDKRNKFNTLVDVESYLLHDLRIDESLLSKINLDVLSEIGRTYKNKNLDQLYQFIKKRYKNA